MALGDGPQLGQPLERAAEVGHEDDLAAGRRAAGDEPERRLGRARLVGERLDVARAGPRAVAGRLRRAVELRVEQRREERGPAGARRDGAIHGAAERDDAEAVAALGGEVGHRDRHALGHVGLAPVGGAELHRRRAVEHEPRRERPLRDVDADVRDLHPGGDVPVDPPDVVARLVRPDLGELRAAAEVAGPVVPGDEAADLARDRQLERAEQRLGRRAGAGTGRRAGAGPRAVPCRRGERHAVRSSVIWRGAGTAGRMRARIESAVTSSARAVKRRDDAVAQDVRRQLVDVGGDDVPAAAQEGERPGRVDEVDRAARAGAERDVASRGPPGRRARARGSRTRSRPRRRRAPGRRRSRGRRPAAPRAGRRRGRGGPAGPGGATARRRPAPRRRSGSRRRPSS